MQEEPFEEESRELDPVKGTAARAEEVAYMHNRGLWDVVPIPPNIYLGERALGRRGEGGRQYSKPSGCP